MSVTVVKDKGVTVITVATDKKSLLPPVCQILKALCYVPSCRSAYKVTMQTSVTAVLGTIQIMVGLVTIGLGPGRVSQHPEDFSHLGVAYWLGGVCLVSGLLSVLAGRFPSVYLVGLAVLMNVVGSVVSIVGIVRYSIDLSETITNNLCGWEAHSYTCDYVADYFRRLLTGMDITLIVLTVLHLCVCISFAVLGIKALINRKKEKDLGDVEIYHPDLKEALLTSPCA
uniref:membrane-spanning 4-domains subfamily A member 4A-like n=1 Tax=Semicossyphus pulcher TaxID=241346 RepID=UPI0037E7CBB1